MEQGFNWLKGNPLEGRSWPLDRREVHRCSEIVYAVRKEVGLSVELMLDCHGSPTPELAIDFGYMVADAAPLFIEEPCKYGSVEALAQISQRSAVPIAMGEKLFTFQEFKEVIDRRACAFLQPDIAHSFGLTNFIHIAHAAAQQQMLMAPHNAGGPIYFSALMHAEAAIENLLIQEANCTWFRRFGEWAEHDWVLKDGFIELNDRPGLGLEIREEVVAAQMFDRSMDFRQYRRADSSWKGWYS